MNYLKNAGLIFVFSMMFSAIPALGKTWYVAPGGTGTETGSGWDNATGDIQAAVDLADDGDIVLVSNGTYKLAAHITINKPITVKGFYASEAEWPVIDGQNSVRGFYITHADAQVTGFMVSNCAPGDLLGDGGGVYLTAGLLNDCLVVSNNSAGYGGGVYLSGGAVSNTTIQGNTSSSGGGGIALAANKSAYVFGGKIAANATFRAGGGIHVPNTAMLYLENTEVHSNSAQYGGGIYVYGKASINNCDISSNTATNGSGGGITFNTTGEAGYGTVTHSRVTGNIASNPGATVDGGGINLGKVNGGVLIANSEISGNKIHNSFRARGGGIAATSNAVMRNCFIARNWVEGTQPADGGQGGGVFMNTNAVVPNIIEQCTIVGNYALKQGGGVFLRGDGDDLVRNCIVVDNTAGLSRHNIFLGDVARKADISYTCASEADTDWGAGCFTDDPLFVDPLEANYRLQANSPCLNVGSVQTWMETGVDLDGNLRLDRITRKPDLGCYELILKGTFFYLR